MRLQKLMVLLALLAAVTASAQAQSPAYDGLTRLGQSRSFPVDGGGSLTLIALRTKYKEPVVGFYFRQGNAEVRFYANAATWDRFKQVMIKARDQWDTLSSDVFKGFGSVVSYRIANRQSVMRLGLQGATALSPKMLFMNCTGGPSELKRVSVHFSRGTLRSLVEDFQLIDGAFRNSTGASPSPGASGQ